MSTALVTLSEFDLRVVDFSGKGLTAIFNQYEETGTGQHYNLVSMKKNIQYDPALDTIKEEFKFLVGLVCGLYGNIDMTKNLSAKNQEFVDLVNDNLTIRQIQLSHEGEGYSVEVKAEYQGAYGIIKQNTPKVTVLEEEGIKTTSGKYLYDTVVVLKKEVHEYLFNRKYAQLELALPEPEPEPVEEETEEVEEVA